MTKEFGENKGTAKALDARDFSGGILGKRNVVAYVNAKSVRWGLFHHLRLPQSLSYNDYTKYSQSSFLGFHIELFLCALYASPSFALHISLQANCDLGPFCSVRKHCLFLRMLF